jgi:two-component system phosphate regulon sensor histidine kinase PhoR
MKNRTLFQSFFGVQILILFVAISFVTFYTWFTSRNAFYRQWFRELRLQAELVSTLLPDDNNMLDTNAVRRLFTRISHSESHRFTLVLPDGKVIGDTQADPVFMDLHHDRPEIRDAMQNGHGFQRRYSASMGMMMLYLAERMPQHGPLQAVIRVAVPERTLMHELNASNRYIIMLIIVVFLGALAVSYWSSLRIIGPVSDFQQGLQRLGQGEFSFRLSVPDVPHLSTLARSINQTAERIEHYITALDEERNLRALILANMARGVCAIDQTRIVRDINQSAKRMLGLETVEAVTGTRISELVRHPGLLNLIDISEVNTEPIDREMTFGLEQELLLNVRATPLADMQGQRIGTLILLNDITLFRRLETVRQDFVANVSHELRTPVTSIKGFAETLLDGAKNDPMACERFLKIIVRQANQLESIIHDLLELSRLEDGAAALEKQRIALQSIVMGAVELCQHSAREKNVELVVSCQKEVEAVVQPGLVEQALVNLIDNAIKYGVTETHRRVEISASCANRMALFSVRDFGNGIPKNHLDRIFERFYRVDKGRSREMGGTGLGLAIVKHIALVHNGTVSVSSESGSGSTFTIQLPV